VDAASIAQRIDGLLANPALRSSMGEAGYAKVMKKYAWPAVAGRVRAIYEDCIKAAKAS
jgi:glycosyltransferase involved in cell wall biosynthesis